MTDYSYYISRKQLKQINKQKKGTKKAAKKYGLIQPKKEERLQKIRQQKRPTGVLKI